MSLSDKIIVLDGSIESINSSTILLQRSISSDVKFSFAFSPLIKAISALSSDTSFFSLWIIRPGSTYSFLLTKF